MSRIGKQTQTWFERARSLAILLLSFSLLGCYAGSVKPLLNHPDFKRENEPIRTLRLLLITDDSYPRDEIERFVSRCSSLVEMQVGVRLEIVDYYQIHWEDELNDILKMETRVAGDTWNRRETFDIALTFAYFVQKIEGGRSALGATDTYFWRYLFVKEPDPYIFLHELFHTFLLRKGHSKDWVMRGARPPYGNEWYWLTSEDRKEVLRNKWRDFNLMPVTEGEEETKSKASWFYYHTGLACLRKGEFDLALLLFNESLEVKPEYAAAYENRGVVYTHRGQYDQAIADFSKAVEIDPKYAEAYANRARAYYFKGEYDRSWEDIKRSKNLGYSIPAEFLKDLRKVSEKQH